MSISRAVQHVQIIGLMCLRNVWFFTFRFLTYINHDFRGDPATYTSDAYSFQMILIYIVLSALEYIC